MRISIFTTITNPEERQDPWKESFASNHGLADELIIINGGMPLPVNIGLALPKIKEINMPMPDNWSWEDLPKRVDRGLEVATGDWAISMDVDWMFHEKDFKKIRETLETVDAPVASFQKASFYKGGIYQKGYTTIAVNKGMFGDKIRFGSIGPEDDNLTTPVVAERRDKRGVWEGPAPTKCAKIGVSFFNFDYTFKDDNQINVDAFAASQARKRTFGWDDWGKTPEEAGDKARAKIEERARSATKINLNELPIFIQEKAKRFYE